MTQSLLKRAGGEQPVDVMALRAAEPEPDTGSELDAARHARLRRVWLLWLAGALLFSAGQMVTAPAGVAGAVLTAVMPLLFTGGVVLGVLLNRPRRRGPWLMLAVAGLVTIAGLALWVAGAGTIAYAVFASVYPLEAAALLLVVRGASWREDRAGALDTAMITVGLALACWLLVITPRMRRGAELPDDVFAVLFPFGDVLLLAVLVRFFTSQSLRNAAFWQLSASLLLQTATHLATLLPIAADLRGLQSFSALLMAAAAIHPSMRILCGRPLQPVTEMKPRRVLLVNLACMGAPALLLAQGVLQRGQVGWVAAGIGCMVLFALVTLRMVDLVGQVQDKARQLDAVAHIDALTTLPNRRAWDLELSRRIAAARRHGTPVVVAILDLDHFKRFNDEHGHQGGDALLCDAAAAWRDQVRPEDLLARYGGEEFGAIFEHARLSDADRIIERLQTVTPHGQTFSAGAAQWNGTESAEDLLARADAALYAAKRAGRNRVYVSSTR